MTKKIYFRPVIPLVVSLMTGLCLGSRVPDHRPWIYIVVCISTAVILWAVKKKKTVFVSPLILFAAMGYLSIQPWVAPEFSPHHIIHHVDSYPIKIAGVIDTHPWKNANRKKFLLQTETIRVNNRSFHVTGKIRVTVSGKGPDLFKGDRISFSSKIRSVRNFNNPGGFDYKRYMAFKKVWGTSYVSGDRVFIEKRDSNKGIQRIITSARSKIAHLIDTTGEGKQQNVLKALILGDKNSISPDLRDAFNRAGVGHLLAISGLHIGIVATAAFVFFRFIFSRVNLFLFKAWTKKGAVILSVIPICTYGLLSGMLPSTQRAVIMVIVFLMALLFEREQDTMNTLAVAAMVILVVNPPSLFSVSFQLSFIAVLTIIYGLSKLQVLVTLNARGVFPDFLLCHSWNASFGDVLFQSDFFGGPFGKRYGCSSGWFPGRPFGSSFGLFIPVDRFRSLIMYSGRHCYFDTGSEDCRLFFCFAFSGNKNHNTVSF
jgi:competence protein ComEC